MGRDERLLALAWQALADGSPEILLTEDTIAGLTDPAFDEQLAPPHVEVAARIHATSQEALDRGDYLLTIAPARAAGTLTSRFTPLADGTGLDHVYRTVPTATDGALLAQMSFPPVYPHAENIVRIPAYLPYLLSLGEHRADGSSAVTPVDDLAILATPQRLYLVSASRQQVVEPQVFHALALEKQPPPLARFLAHLPRAFSAHWHEFDWGPHAHRLPYLPRLRYGRTIICAARWRLTPDDLSAAGAGTEEWQQALNRWRRRWHCPAVVELRDADRTLRLAPDVPAHAAVLDAHLRRYGEAMLTEAASADAYGWIDGHAHEIAVPLVTTRSPAPSPLAGALPLVTNGHGQLPGSVHAAWLYAKIYSHPERHDEIISDHLSCLLAALGEPEYWFVRYRSPHETDHLRLRLRTGDRDRHAECAAALTDWVDQLRHAGLATRLVFDTYFPEVGRYGDGPALHAAEAVFAADSRVVAATLRHNISAEPTALVAVNMFDIVHGLLVDRTEAVYWLIDQPTSATTATGRDILDQAVELVGHGPLVDLPGWPPHLTDAWQARSAALGVYRQQLPASADTDMVLESLLHLHHNRAAGIDPDHEGTCRRLARQTAIAWRARQNGGHR